MPALAPPLCFHFVFFLLLPLCVAAAGSKPNAPAGGVFPPEGQSVTIDDLQLTLRPIPAGTFQMGTASGGADAERPVMAVTISRPFWLGESLVTQAQWLALMGDNPAHLKGPERPVEHVSWTDAMAFCEKLTTRERQAGRLPPGYVYTLPTEAQWEYACRAGTTGEFSGDLDAMAWYQPNTDFRTEPVKRKQPNAWGLYDMHGNLWELCFDWFALYPGGPVTDPSGPETGTHRISRGGSWKSPAAHLGSAHRNREHPWNRNANLGFRVALTPER